MYGIAFEWGPKKLLTNLRKHGVGFADESTVFDDPLSITIPELRLAVEERFVIIGMSNRKKP